MTGAGGSVDNAAAERLGIFDHKPGFGIGHTQFDNCSLNETWLRNMHVTGETSASCSAAALGLELSAFMNWG
jgi:hypothetical protein